MILMNELDSLKAMAEVQADIIPGGIIYGITEGDTMTWVKHSKVFSMDVFHVGKKLESNSTTIKSIREKKVVEENIDRSVYGIRLTITSIPIIDGNGNSAGAFSMAVPHLHPVFKAFKDFAPIVSEMFSEGAFMILSDLNKISETCGSKKFDINSIKVGNDCRNNAVVKKVLETGNEQDVELDSSKYGVPVRVASHPLFDEDTNKIVGTIGIITPKEVAANLRNMASNLSQGITGISSAIEELAASASQIHENEQNLNAEIGQVTSMSDKINEISSFIKDIADATKMLGINASIEAARAGQAGSGFGVVANEIRKLSEESKSTVPKINELTQNIKGKVECSSKMSHDSLSSSQEQAAATQEITASIEELSSLAESLDEIARQL